jgi:hypothetical protein
MQGESGELVNQEKLCADRGILRRNYARRL